MGREQWFNDSQFGTAVCALREKIARHNALVTKGLARSDIFELENALKFNRNLLHMQISELGTLGRDAQKCLQLVQLLQGAAVEPVVELKRVVEDAIALYSQSALVKKNDTRSGGG